MEHAVGLYGGNEGARFRGEFVEEEDDGVSFRLIEQRHRRDEERLCGGRPSEELGGGSRDLQVQEAIRRIIQKERGTERRVAEIEGILNTDGEIVDSPRDRPAFDALRAPLWGRGLVVKVSREFGDRDTMIARKVEGGFTVDVPPILTILPCEPEIEDVVRGSIRNMPACRASPRFQERIKRHLKAHALVVCGER
jgi:hypothetical protein